MALIQAAVSEDVAANMEKTARKAEEAAKKGAQIICLQELYRTRYFPQVEKQDASELAEAIPGPSTELLCSLAKKHSVAVVLPIFEKSAEGKHYNTAVAIDADGKVLGKYRKIHVPDDPLFILVRYLNKSNRSVEEALGAFQPLFGVDVSYKYIERLYSDPEVKLALHNLFVLLLKEEGVSGDLAGDGTGYSVRVDSHYRTDIKKFGKKYVHFFALIDLKTGMYVGCGTSRSSEWDAFSKAMAMLRRIGVAVKSIRLDKYFSTRTVIRLFDRSVSLFLIPRGVHNFKSSNRLS